MIYTAASAAREGETEGGGVIHCCIRGWRGGEGGGGECDIHCCIRGWRGGERGRV